MAKIFSTVVKKVVQAAGGLNYRFSNVYAVGLKTFYQNILALLRPAFRVTTITYSYAGLYGAATATTAAVSGNTVWTNPANAQGTNNATNATLASSLTAAANANLTLSYAGVTGKTVFVIAKVELVFYAALTLGLAQTASVTYRYSLGGTGGTFTQLFTSAAAFTHSGQAYDITAAVGGNYANLANVAVQVNGNLGTAASSGTASVDAVLLRITTTPITQAA